VQFTVREYRSQDFETIWQIDQACFPPGISYSQAELALYLRRPGAFSFIAESEVKLDGSRVLGFLVGESNRRRVGHIITIDVRAEARRHTVGSRLLEAGETRLIQANCNVVRLETAVDNVSALSFYKRHGYDVTKTIPSYYSNGVDGLLLEKNLLSSVSSR